MTRALYPGSFNPFTRGHLDIVARALRMFDEIVICIGVNIHKPDSISAAEQTKRHLDTLFEGFPIRVVVNDRLTIDMVRQWEADCIIRGVRNVSDFEYEKTLAETNALIGGAETILLCARPELSCLSSSMVRELAHFGYDTSRYLATREDIMKMLD